MQKSFIQPDSGVADSDFKCCRGFKLIFIFSFSIATKNQNHQSVKSLYTLLNTNFLCLNIFTVWQGKPFKNIPVVVVKKLRVKGVPVNENLKMFTGLKVFFKVCIRWVRAPRSLQTWSTSTPGCYRLSTIQMCLDGCWAYFFCPDQQFVSFPLNVFHSVVVLLPDCDDILCSLCTCWRF